MSSEPHWGQAMESGASVISHSGRPYVYRSHRASSTSDGRLPYISTPTR